jgi:hypothetical protein
LLTDRILADHTYLISLSFVALMCDPLPLMVGAIHSGIIAIVVTQSGRA